MYCYIYDTYLGDRRFDRVLSQVETRLTDLGISGKIFRLTPFTNAKNFLRDEIRRGVKTVVVVGCDDTVAKIIDGLGDEKVTLGIVPVGAPSEIAKALGIPEGVDACDVLSRRVTQKIDLGMVNGHYFISQVRIPAGRLTIEGEGKYRVSAPANDCEVLVHNLRGATPNGTSTMGDPRDGYLDAMITPHAQGIFRGFFRKKVQEAPSVIPLRRIYITTKDPMAATADGRSFSTNQFTIEVVPERLKVITGRDRKFS